MKQVLTIAAVIAVFGAVGEMDYRDELKQYQTMVCEGTWPNYKDLEVDCNGQHSGKAHSLAQWGQ